MCDGWRYAEDLSCLGRDQAVESSSSQRLYSESRSTGGEGCPLMRVENQTQLSMHGRCLSMPPKLKKRHEPNGLYLSRVALDKTDNINLVARYGNWITGIGSIMVL